MVFEKIEKLPACNLSLQRWKVLQEIMALGLKGCEDREENRKELVLNGMLLVVSPWPSDLDESFCDFSHMLVEDFYEN